MRKVKIRSSPERVTTLYQAINALGIDPVAEPETVSSLNEMYFPEWNPTYK